MRKTKCIALLVGITIIGSLLLPIGSVKAASTQTVQIENRGTMSYFRYEGNLVNQRYLMHKQDGSYHPVYRISASAENAPDDIQAEVGNAVIDKKLYQIVKAGYPYKSASQLGCTSDFYAYIATQTAIDCYVRGYTLEKLEAVSSEAEIMKQAVSHILENSAKEVQVAKLSIDMTPTKEWEWIENKEMQKEYEICCNYEEIEYTVSTTQDTVQIRNVQNEKQSTFSGKEPMRLAVTKEALAQDITWNTTVQAHKCMKDIYQTQSTSNGKTYVLCSYEFAQEAEVTFEETLQAYQEEPEPLPNEHPNQDTNDTTPPNSEEVKQEMNGNMQNTEESIQDTKEIAAISKHPKQVLPETGF